MYVRWKILFGLGTTLWVSLCLHDAFFVNPTTNFYYADSDALEWLNHVAHEEIVEEDPHPAKDDIEFPFEGYKFGVSMLLWNLLAFVVTILVCSLGKISLVYFMELQAKYSRYRQMRLCEGLENPLSRKTATSKIPILTSTSRSSIAVRENEDKDKSTGSLISSSSTSVEVRPCKSEVSSRLEQQMEKQCAKLRDEMILVQANSLKEHAALSRKLESVSREKRDLYRQLMVTQKENRGAREQLEELLAEKALLVKRLECASKEFKTNTKAKKAALANLEESQVTIAALKQELERMSHERASLENKFKILDAEHKRLKERLAKYEHPVQDSVYSKSGLSEDDYVPKIGYATVTKDVQRSPHLTEITQSQRDVQRVQVRLMNLEKSLDRLKLSDLCKKDDKKNATPKSSPRAQNTSHSLNTTDSEEFENFVASIATQAESPLEDQVRKSPRKVLLVNDNLTDEERRRILDPTESSGDEHSVASKLYDCVIETDQDPFQRVGNLLNYVKQCQSPIRERFDGNTFFESASDEITNDTSQNEEEEEEEEEKDDWEPPSNRMVSNSPAFQMFLKRMDSSDLTQKFTAL